MPQRLGFPSAIAFIDKVRAGIQRGAPPPPHTTSVHRIVELSSSMPWNFKGHNPGLAWTQEAPQLQVCEIECCRDGSMTDAEKRAVRELWTRIKAVPGNAELVITSATHAQYSPSQPTCRTLILTGQGL